MTIAQNGAAGRAETELPVYTRAALGDGEAHSILADAQYRMAQDGSVPRVIALGHATIFARLASMSRGARNDWFSLIFLLEHYSAALREAGQDNLADTAQAEAVTYADYMADDGDEEVGRMVAAAAETIPVRVMQIAKSFHDYTKGIADADGAPQHAI